MKKTIDKLATTAMLARFASTPAVPDGKACPCGRRGCLETYVGGRMA